VRREIDNVTRTDPAAYLENSVDPDRKFREALEFGGEELVNVKLPPPAPEAMPATSMPSAPQVVTAEPKDTAR